MVCLNNSVPTVQLLGIEYVFHTNPTKETYVMHMLRLYSPFQFSNASFAAALPTDMPCFPVLEG